MKLLPHTPLIRVQTAIEKIRNGQMVIVVDAENRENEGDLVMAAEKCSPETINFMARWGRGLICMPIAPSIANRLQLAPMTTENRSHFQTAFTVSVGSKHGITTGISAHDRAHTVQTCVSQKSCPMDIVSPGHIFPLISNENGVLGRPGHTEAAVDMAKLAGLTPAGVICEILNDDGSMARLTDLLPFAKKHDLMILTIEDLIDYRTQNPTERL